MINFSIVITTYQRKDGTTPLMLKRALDSIFNQEYQNFKIYVIGDKYENNEEFELIFKNYPKDKIYYENLPIAYERDRYTDKWLIWSYAGCYANNYGNWNFTVGPYDLGGFRFGKAGTKGGRMINPTDYKKWDPKLEYVRKYIPELKDVPDRDIFSWNTAWKKHPNVNYSKPIVDFKVRKDEWYKITKR